MLTSIEARGVHDAYQAGMLALHRHGLWERTRNGMALVMPWPVVTITHRPIERVLLTPERDANPFFHLMESLWMLAGAEDVESLDAYNHNLKKYSDDGLTYHGAYGHRWRVRTNNWTPPCDQLETIIALLRKNPGDRRIVLQMWDAISDLGQEGLDFPCNTQVYFRGRGRHLDMTVTCRSNDAIWGAHGANAVHFSVLQELVAGAVGLQVGTMYQLSNNYHAYDEALTTVQAHRVVETVSPNESGEVDETPIFDPRVLQTLTPEGVCSMLTALWEDQNPSVLSLPGQMVVESMREAYTHFRKGRREDARTAVRGMPERSDWRRACGDWLERRYAARPREK